ncbi:MAG: polysaccharide biosynthesis protein [Bacteroidales bacterium]|nr:polysaccharide biosynthesis protein [Bacteroidales bacterium]
MNLISKYYNRFLSYKAVFFLDLFLSLLSSVIVLLVMTFFAGSHSYYAGTFSLWWLGSSVVATAIALLLVKSYRLVIRHTSFHDIITYFLVALVKVVLMGVAVGTICIFNFSIIVALGLDFLVTLLFFVGMRVLMMTVYNYHKQQMNELKSRQRVLVLGTSDKSVAAITRLQNSPHYRVVGFISHESTAKQLKLSDYPIFYYQSDKELQDVFDRLSISALLFANEKDAQRENALIDYCNHNNIKLLIAPTINEVEEGRFSKNRVRAIKIEDLLGRPEIELSMDAIISNFKGKIILVTGAAGSIGSELCRQLATFGVKRLILFDNAETPMHNIRLELEGRFPELDFVPVIGDVRQQARLDFAFRHYHPQVVFHAAAYKHVPLMEENPCEAVLVNVYGSRNVADKCIEYDVEKMVMISTDKAVNPTNVMGCSKRLAEIYVQSLGLAIEQGKHPGKTKFVTTRFGNVLGSNGSVIPRFREQIENGGPVTVTHPDITRFFMTIPEACRLVMEAATMSTGTQIFVFDMGESVKIDTLARRMINLAGFEVGKDIEIKYTGLRPGEKLYEEVLSNKENTLPTPHERIRIAKVREYEYNEVAAIVDELEDLSRKVEIPDMVKLMKRTVPEFISKNSRFEIYDKQ